MKKCPYCAEEIQEEAIKCKHCGEFLGEARRGETRRPWYYGNTAIVIGFLCIGPFVLPLVWLNPRYSRITKIVITAVMILITWLLVRLLSFSLANLEEYYNLLKSLSGN